MELTISYSQLMLMNYDGEQPYVDWTDEDFERGYAKADGTVIFEALSDYTCEVKVTQGKHMRKKKWLERLQFLLQLKMNVSL